MQEQIQGYLKWAWVRRETVGIDGVDESRCAVNFV